MKKTIIAFLLCVPFVLSAQKSGSRISATVYGGLGFFPNSFFEGVDVLYRVNRHVMSVGPYFTKTSGSNFDPGLHAGYYFFAGHSNKLLNTFFSLDYLYFDGNLNSEAYGAMKSTRHMLTIGYGLNYNISERVFLTSHFGLGYARIKDRIDDPQYAQHNNDWNGIMAIFRLGVGYNFVR